MFNNFPTFRKSFLLFENKRTCHGMITWLLLIELSFKSHKEFEVDKLTTSFQYYLPHVVARYGMRNLIKYLRYLLSEHEMILTPLN